MTNPAALDGEGRLQALIRNLTECCRYMEQHGSTQNLPLIAEARDTLKALSVPAAPPPQAEKRCTCTENFANPEPVDCPIHEVAPPPQDIVKRFREQLGTHYAQGAAKGHATGRESYEACPHADCVSACDAYDAVVAPYVPVPAVPPPQDYKI